MDRAVEIGREVAAVPGRRLKGMLQALDHTDVGKLPRDANPILTAAGRSTADRFPSLGENNREVMISWLGYSPEEAAAAEADGVLMTVPRPPS